MNTETIMQCMRASFADTPFPLVVQRLAGAGVTHYRADLMKLTQASLLRPLTTEHGA